MRVQIVGATGYGGLGILELLLQHPVLEPSALIARDDAGRAIADIYPHLAGRTDLVVQAPDEADIGNDCDAVAFATPDRVSMGYAAALADAGRALPRLLRRLPLPRRALLRRRYAAAHPSIGDSAHEAAALLGRATYGV